MLHTLPPLMLTIVLFDNLGNLRAVKWLAYGHTGQCWGRGVNAGPVDSMPSTVPFTYSLLPSQMSWTGVKTGGSRWGPSVWPWGWPWKPLGLSCRVVLSWQHSRGSGLLSAFTGGWRWVCSLRFPSCYRGVISPSSPLDLVGIPQETEATQKTSVQSGGTFQPWGDCLGMWWCLRHRQYLSWNQMTIYGRFL